MMISVEKLTGKRRNFVSHSSNKKRLYVDLCGRIKERSTKIPPNKGGQRGVSKHSYCMYIKHPSKFRLRVQKMSSLLGNTLCCSNLELPTQINIEPEKHNFVPN